MGWRNDEPVPNTCPLIDSVKAFVSEAPAEEGITRMDELMGRCEKTNTLNTLEDIRTANSTLREWGVENSKRVYDLEAELEELKTDKDEEIRRLEEIIGELTSELEEARSEIETLTSNPE